MRIAIKATFAMVACCQAALPVSGQTEDKRLAKGLQDNSFLIEEAYNQEAGVVQHILGLRRQGHDWALNFTQEWPIHSQTHQFSYTVPYLWLKGDGGSMQGVGDVVLNYRYQALTETNTRPAFAPRIGLILPSGDRAKETGNGSAGYQLSLPFSKIVGDRLTLHGNGGVTSYFDVGGRQPMTYTVGGSAVLALTREFNLMFETVGEWTESVNRMSEIEREFTLTVLPGMRYAINLPEQAQAVVGLGAPVTFSRGPVEYGVFLYMSLEHKFSP